MVTSSKKSVPSLTSNEPETNKISRLINELKDSNFLKTLKN